MPTTSTSTVQLYASVVWAWRRVGCKLQTDDDVSKNKYQDLLYYRYDDFQIQSTSMVQKETNIGELPQFQWEATYKQSKTTRTMKWAFLLMQTMPLACIVAPVTATTTSFLVKSRSPTCDGDFELTGFQFTCGDECVVGSTVDVSGARTSDAPLCTT